MTKIILPPQNDIYSYGFDKSLNRIITKQSLPENEVEVAVRNVLLQSGIDVNTVNGVSSGNFERNDLHWFSVFESKDGIWSTTNNVGTTSLNNGYVTVSSGANINSYILFEKYFEYPPIIMSWDKKRNFKTTIRFNTNSNQEIYIYNGVFPSSRHIGFYIDDNTIYAESSDGTSSTRTAALATFNAFDQIDFKVAYFPKTKVDFYINDIFVASIKTNLPAGTTNSKYLLRLYAVTKENVAKNFNLSYWDFWQES